MPAAKLPIADFRTQADWHTYLGKLTPAQLKKVAAALNRILRTEFRLNTKKPAAELLEDVKKLYSVNNNTRLLEIVKGIDADQLPQPSQNLPKPTKKQIAAGKEADKARVRKVIEERVSKAKEDMKQAEIKKKQEEEARRETQRRENTLKYLIKQEKRRELEVEQIAQGKLKFSKSAFRSAPPGSRTKAYAEARKEAAENKSFKSNPEADKQRLIDNWDNNDESLFDLYNYMDYKDLNLFSLEKYINSKSINNSSPDGENTFVINLLARKLPKDLINTIYEKYGLKKLLLGLVYITTNIRSKEQKMMLDDAYLPGAKLNNEYQKFIKPIIDNKLNVGYKNIIKVLND